MLLTSKDLKHYQIAGGMSIVNKRKSAVFLKPGLGKTAMTLKAMAHIKKHEKIKRILIVAPIHVCTDVWMQEAKKWIFSQEFTFTLLRGSPQKRISLANRETDVYLINYELLSWFLTTCKNKKFDMVIYDEVSKLANIKSKVFKVASKKLNYVPWRVGLTGTPVGNKIQNLFGEMYSCCGDKPLGGNFYDFRAKYFHAPLYGRFDWKPKENAKADIFRAIHDFSYSYIPENSARPAFYPITCIFGHAQDDLARKVRTTNVLDDQPLTAADTVNKISQLESGFFYSDGKAESVNEVKINKTKELVEELEGESLLVFYRYKEDAVRLQKLGFKTKDESNFIDKWNHKEITKLALHPASVGHGINLQEGGANILFYGLPWSVELFDQSIGRLLRIGQRKQVTVYWFACDQERLIFKALKERKSVEDELIKSLIEEEK